MSLACAVKGCEQPDVERVEWGDEWTLVDLCAGHREAVETPTLHIIRAELVGFAEPYDGADPTYQRGKQYGLQLAIGAIDSRMRR